MEKLSLTPATRAQLLRIENSDMPINNGITAQAKDLYQHLRENRLLRHDGNLDRRKSKVPAKVIGEITYYAARISEALANNDGNSVESEPGAE